jgi:ubiquinone/menaquinone biosynthesis C-methylase UbiE
MARQRTYLSAAGYDVLLPLYDPLTKLLGARRLLATLLAQADLQPRQMVLDIGCGTGTLAILIKQTHPGVDVTGLDPDAHALARATRKAERAHAPVRFERGFADALGYGDGTFDRVFSSMMFHHLGRQERTKALAEIRRVLKPRGRLEFLDFAGGAHNMLAQMLHGRTLRAAAEERLLWRMTEAGLVDARRVATKGTFLGPVAYYQASAPVA